MGRVVLDGGFHGTSVFGTMGATAACAKLIGLDLNQTRMAFGIAASGASGILQNFGTYTKPLHAGYAVRAALTGTKLAKMGFDADKDIIEAPRGYVFAFGQEQTDLGKMTEHLGNPFALARSRITVKPWPCCGSNHRPIMATCSLAEKYDIKPEDVVGVDVGFDRDPLHNYINLRYPARGYDGKFSVIYNVAAALIDRKVDRWSFTDESFSRPIMQDTLKKVKLYWHPERAGKPTKMLDERRFAVITIKLKNGKEYSERRDSGRSLEGDEVISKYKENAYLAGLPERKTMLSIKLVQDLEKLEKLTSLMDALTI